MFYYIDWTYIVLVIPAMILALYAQNKVNSTFKKYSRVASRSGMTGAQAARRLMELNGIYDVSIERVSGNLTDHYDPSKKVLRLSDSVYSDTSVAAIGVAAHETGHAIQHARGYVPLTLRTVMVPLANLGSTLSMPLIFLGILFSFSSVMGNTMINLGILLFGLSVVFTIITLPVEFNASRRAVACLGDSGILYDDEIGGVKKVLSAAAMTYVASTAVALANFLRLIIIFGGRRRD
ncbi:zinc metallopeptidase [Anaerotignum sp. MSJ-24]|uniref:zinc metallopeptidase n=1 Tax=Anaerotignum sp. MSJ-24 TaxID=2841521 RepID=UPI001C115C0F|nr:zinc metallopeptidase [Anaerotignum sp. MSJ-24]MBU5464879.1 zinc metallopeptidase [Anaerotignum sp. MSJ-24]